MKNMCRLGVDLISLRGIPRWESERVRKCKMLGEIEQYKELVLYLCQQEKLGNYIDVKLFGIYHY
jgi:hypothetical protein